MPVYMDKTENREQVTLPVNIVRHSNNIKQGFTGRAPAFQRHNHAVFELLYIIQGELLVMVEEQRYLLKKGDVILFNPFELHTGQYLTEETESSYLCLTFTMGKFLGYYTNSALAQVARDFSGLRKRFDCFYPVKTESASILSSCICDIYENFNKKTPASECIVVQNLFAILALLLDKHCREAPGKQQRKLDFIRKVSDYVDRNYQQIISPGDVAVFLCLTTSQFSHLFKSNFGCRFLTYLCEYRIQKSLDYLESDMSITDIAAAVGFLDYCYFSKAFKRYMGITPAVFFGRWNDRKG